MTPSPFRSTQSIRSLAILVTEGCPLKARLATHTSKLKSTAVRDGLLPPCCTVAPVTSRQAPPGCHPGFPP